MKLIFGNLLFYLVYWRLNVLGPIGILFKTRRSQNIFGEIAKRPAEWTFVARFLS